MIFIKKPLVLLAIVFALIPAYGFAQYTYEVAPFFSYFKDLSRYEISGNVSLASGTFKGVAQVQGPGYIGDTTAKRNITSQGIGASIGLSIPIKGTGHISCWAVAVQLMANNYIWKDLNETYGIDGSYKKAPASLNAMSNQIALPLGLEYKIGTDAIKSKRLLLGTSLGAGVIPQFNMTSLESVSGFDAGYRVGFTPYAKVEGAIFAGMCIKVRVMYTYGNMSLLDVNKAVPKLSDGPFNLTSTSNLIVSLVLMPFSTRWREYDWWNTYDTYNQHDRFN